MATCSVQIRGDLNGKAPAGGQWAYQGFSSSSAAGPFTDTPASPLFPGVPVGDVIPLGDDFPLQQSGASSGYYKVEYAYPGGLDTLILKIQSTAPCAGGNTSLTLSASDATVYDLIDELPTASCPTVTPGGVWTDISDVSAGAGFNSATGELTPNLTPGAGIYKFRYSIAEAGFTPFLCPTCPLLEVVVTVTLTATLDVSIVPTDDICTFTIEIHHPDTDNNDEVKLVLSNDAFYPTITGKKVIDSCEGEIHSEVFQLNSTHTVETKIDMLAGENLLATGYFELITMSSTTGGVKSITVPLAPFGGNQAVLTGSGGTVNANDLQYTGTNQPAMINALKKVIRNYLIDVEGLVEGTNFALDNIFQLTGGGLFAFSFRVRHNPSAEWVGLSRGVTKDELRWRIQSGDLETIQEVNGGKTQSVGLQVPWSRQTCPSAGSSLIYRVNNFVPVNTATSDYNLISLLLSDPISISPNLSLSRLTADCASKLLTTVVLNCVGSLTYLWSTGDTTASINVSPPGTFSVEATCTSPAASGEAQITV